MKRLVPFTAIAVLTACSSGFLAGLSGGVRSDAGAGLEAGLDAGQTLPSGCDASASFCDDFDQGALGATWTDASTTPNGVMALVEGGLSPPFALRASFETGTPNTTAYLTKSVHGSPRIRCEVDLMIPSPPVQGEVDYLAFVTPPATTTDAFSYYKLYVTIFDGAWNIGEYGRMNDGGKLDRAKQLSTPLPAGQWVHVTFQTSNDEHTLSVAIADGGSATMTSLADFYFTQREIQVGIAFASSGADTSSALYDNLSCDWSL